MIDYILLIVFWSCLYYIIVSIIKLKYIIIYYLHLFYYINLKHIILYYIILYLFAVLF